jgi:hypothetical protein
MPGNGECSGLGGVVVLPWLPRVRASFHPSDSTRRIASLTFIAAGYRMGRQVDSLLPAHVTRLVSNYKQMMEIYGFCIGVGVCAGFCANRSQARPVLACPGQVV